MQQVRFRPGGLEKLTKRPISAWAATDHDFDVHLQIGRSCKRLLAGTGRSMPDRKIGRARHIRERSASDATEDEIDEGGA